MLLSILLRFSTLGASFGYDNLSDLKTLQYNAS